MSPYLVAQASHFDNAITSVGFTGNTPAGASLKGFGLMGADDGTNAHACFVDLTLLG